MKGALGSERKESSALRASDPIALLPRGPFNLEDARIPRLTYTKTITETTEYYRKLSLCMIISKYSTKQYDIKVGPTVL